MSTYQPFVKTLDPYRIVKHPSMFTNRPGQSDIVIHIKTGANWGALYDGCRYTIAKILDAETLEPIRDYSPVPNEVLDNLKTWGF